MTERYRQLFREMDITLLRVWLECAGRMLTTYTDGRTVDAVYLAMILAQQELNQREGR